MRNASFWCCLSLLLALAGSELSAATIVFKKVEHEILSDGRVGERVVISVRLDSQADVERWSSHSVYLDEHIELKMIAGSARTPAGKSVVIDPKKTHEIALSSGGVLHGSARSRVAIFEEVLPIGTVVSYEHQTVSQPYYRSGRIGLYDDDTILDLQVELRGGGDDLHWEIVGDPSGLELEELPGGLILRAKQISGQRRPDFAPDSIYPSLRYDWTGDPGWETVGSWYSELIDSLPRGDEALLAQARELIGEDDDRWEQLNRLVRFSQRQIRYVAIEVGVGGYRPSPPAETFERRWGDCKDKALLLIDMLKEAGVEAYPALIQSGFRGRIDPAFPSNIGFNHLIVAIELQPWMERDGLAIADGLLFVDPTQGAGVAEWLGPQTQDKHALVVRPDGAQLVRTPTLPQHDRRTILADLTVTPDGSAFGEASYELVGRYASSFLRGLSTEEEQSVIERIRGLFDDLFPGATVNKVRWESTGDAVPRIILGAQVRLKQMVGGTDDRRSFRITAPSGFPKSSVIEDRALPVVLRPKRVETVWRVKLPEGWCPASAKQSVAENELGRFSQRIEQHGRVVEIQRSTEVSQRWVEEAQFDALRELSLAEHRSMKRRVRLRCPSE